MGGGMVSAFYGLLWAIFIILIIVFVVALITWACQNKSLACCEPCRACPVYLSNPHPDTRPFALARVDGGGTGPNGCATGTFTIQRVSKNELLYTVTVPDDALITDIYTLEVGCAKDFPLTSDGCAVDLTAFHHQSFECADTSNVQTFTSNISTVDDKCHIYVSILVVFSFNDETCDPLQMLTLSGCGTKPIALTGSCVTPTCPENSCCDPVVPSYVRIKLPKCRAASSSSSSSASASIAAPAIA